MKLYVFNVQWLYDERAFSSMLGFVGKNRRVKALSHRFVKDRALSLGVGLLLNFALAREAPELSWPPRIRFGKYGKPFLADRGAPEFSLSHAGEYAVCAIGSGQVGVDIERVGIDDVDVARRCFIPGEIPRVMKDGRIDAEAFCRLWTMKESFIKLIGTGLSLDPLCIEIVDSQPARVRQHGDVEPYFLKLYEELTGYKIALCMEGNHFPKQVVIIGKEELCAAVRRVPAS